MKLLPQILMLSVASSVLLSGCPLDSNDSSGQIADCDTSQNLVLAASESCIWNPQAQQPITDPLTVSCTAAGLVHLASNNYNPADVPLPSISIDGTNSVFREVRCSNHPNHPNQ